MTHKVKLALRFFDEVASGAKPFEVRKNDRSYQNGDVLILQEVSTFTGTPTKRECTKRITFVLTDFEGIKSGYAVLGLADVAEGGAA